MNEEPPKTTSVVRLVAAMAGVVLLIPILWVAVAAVLTTVPTTSTATTDAGTSASEVRWEQFARSQADAPLTDDPKPVFTSRWYPAWKDDIAAALKSDDASLRHRAVLALRRTADPFARHHLEKASTEDPDPNVRKTAKRILSRFNEIADQRR